MSSHTTKRTISSRPRINSTSTYGVFQPSGASPARLRAAQNIPIPAMVKPVPNRSNFFNVSELNFCFGIVSTGTVSAATIEVMKYVMAMKKKPARQLKVCVNSPAKIVPKTKPSGLPALKHPKALFFLGLGLSYTVPSIPCAGGTAAAEKIPKTPQRISRVIPSLAKPAPKQRMEKRNIEPMNIVLRPNRSAMLPKKSNRAPAASDVAAFIQVICALVIPRSLAAKELITVIDPVSILVMATAIVTDSTKRHSWSVDLKHAGRALGSFSLRSLVGVVGQLPSSESIAIFDGRRIQG